MARRGLIRVRERVAAAAARAGRDPGDVTIVAVTKGRGMAEIGDVYEFGHRDFGENRPEELAAKAPHLPSDARWHLVGPVQRRKVEAAAPHTHLLHSMDRAALARRWAALDRPPPVLVQVNMAAEPQKHGVSPNAVADLVALSSELGLAVRGLMAIPPLPARPEDSRSWFVALAELRDELAARFPSVRELSMGMSDDFEVAVEVGASFIRVGRAIFDAEPA